MVWSGSDLLRHLAERRPRMGTRAVSRGTRLDGACFFTLYTCMLEFVMFLALYISLLGTPGKGFYFLRCWLGSKGFFSAPEGYLPRDGCNVNVGLGRKTSSKNGRLRHLPCHPTRAPKVGCVSELQYKELCHVRAEQHGDTCSATGSS